jgi:hypothetical protein
MKVCRTIGVLVITVVAAFSVNSQEATKSQSTEPVVASTQTTTKEYVFPTARERFNRYVKSTVGPERLLRTAASAGISQWKDSPEEWGQGAKGYSKRFASDLGQNAIQQTVTYGLDSALKLDTGFQRSKREGFFPRLKDALAQNVTSRNKSGRRVISVPRFVGVYTGAIIANETWYPDRYSYKDGLRRGTGSLLTGFGINVLREFVIKW